MLDQPGSLTAQAPADAPGTAETRRILCVSPRYQPSLGSFEYAYDITSGVQAFMPPQGLLVIAASVPKGWEVRFIDENITPARAGDFRWADAVFVSGMHVQRRQINDIARRAHEAGRVAVLGGPSVSACPEFYPDFDYLHIGEMGDATELLFATLARDSARPPRQIRFETRERLPLDEFPIPAYELANLDKYFIGSIQFSSGCPYRCEFCDIPGLYGRVPRLKSPKRLVAELDKLLACGLSTAVYFVDDNLIANKKALRDLLPHLIAWQERNKFPFYLACEATLNIANQDDLLAMLRDACFTTIFCGIETPEPAALRAIAKEQNLAVPMLEAVQKLNGYGMEVVAGMIIGLDTDTAETGPAIVDFIEQSHIPMVTLNLLQALPRTPLWDRLTRENRLLNDERLESNVAFRRPYQTTLATFRDCLARIYDPATLYERYAHQVCHTFPNRRPRPRALNEVPPKDIKRGLRMLFQVCWKLGVRADFRREFWRFAWPNLNLRGIEYVIGIGMISKHLITFARKACAGELNASHYSSKLNASS